MWSSVCAFILVLSYKNTSRNGSEAILLNFKPADSLKTFGKTHFETLSSLVLLSFRKDGTLRFPTLIIYRQILY